MTDLVTRDDDLRAIVREVGDSATYAIDTEFHRERTYYPRLALVQVEYDRRTHLIDPLSVDVSILTDLFHSGSTALLHAADQDLDVLGHAVGSIPSKIIDTQLAAGFVGMSNPSLATLVERLLNIVLPKSDRLTDWLSRPLTESQIRYAASDVDHLRDAMSLLEADLIQRGRMAWLAEECEYHRTRPRGPRDPDDAWLRIKEARHLRGAARGAVQALAAWRERRAADLDLPVRSVMPDLALVGIAQRKPTSPEALRSIRGVEGRHLRGPEVDELLSALRVGLAARPPEPPRPEGPPLKPSLKPAVALVATWANQRARDLEIDPGILATRSEIEALLRGDSDSRLAHGWRAQVLGWQVRELVEGRASLAFDPDGHLALEERSYAELDSDRPQSD